MAFKDIRLDPAISEGAQGFPDFEPVRISPQDNGNEKRMGTKVEALGIWTISYNAKKTALWKYLRAHHYIVGGRLHSWPMKDWLDFECLASESHLEPIDSTHWQLCKRWSIGSEHYDEQIILPILSTVVVSGSGSYSVSRTTGILTKAGGADPTAVYCKFDKLCRYDARFTQTIAGHRPSGEMIVTCTGISIREIPLSSA